MKGPFRIYSGNTPLTVPITDERRAALGYSVLYCMAEKRRQYHSGRQGIGDDG